MNLRLTTLGELGEGGGGGVAARAEQAGVLGGVALDGAGAVELGALGGELLLAGGAEAALQLALLLLETATVGGSAALVELEALGDVALDLETELLVAGRGFVDACPQLFEQS